MSAVTATTDAGGRGFTPINTTEGFGGRPSCGAVRNGSFSVSSLLTEDKEVRLSPGREKRGEDVEMI